MMTNLRTRRRVLQLTGTGIAASIAGCSDLSAIDGENGDGAEEDGHLTALAEPDASDLQELQQRAMAGELSEEEAIQRQQELFEDAIDDFEGRVDSEAEADLSIEEEEQEGGVYRVDGSADVLVDALRTGEISVLAGTDLYDQIIQQREQQQEQQPEEVPDGEEIEGQDGSEEDE
ncbi:hypothetical protein EA462_07750 [Natrarchaeobius halalkaliphilus]|uniref:Uncharacterized protein n=1 Tax=Natrarchaeobius halalkaliphilus TaxID=1679091 RepID=A0A3N6M8U3_9EURY|nr:hypothetical protein [Natrarchaeobius halalkaliphilus]RQG89896.1 hypothetical protein EA462_07750 [Natrarchaeobius halalkaliphilus]